MKRMLPDADNMILQSFLCVGKRDGVVKKVVHLAKSDLFYKIGVKSEQKVEKWLCAPNMFELLKSICPFFFIHLRYSRKKC